MTQSSYNAPTVLSGPSASYDTTNVLGGTSATTLAYNPTLFTAGQLTNFKSITVAGYVYYAGIAGEYDAFGIGNTYSAYGASGNQGPLIGVIGTGGWAIRPEKNGTIVNAVNSSGGNVVPIATHWYSVHSTWTFTSGGTVATASLAVKDLTNNDPTYTTLYFNAAQNVSTVNLGLSSDNIAQWNTVYVRLSASTSGGYIDNLTATTPISTPTNLAAVETSTTAANVTWTASSGSVTGYDIYRYGTLIGTSTGTSYSDSGPLNEYQSYEYSVAAYDVAGDVTPQTPVTVFAYRRFPFVVPWNDATSNVTDMSVLNSGTITTPITISGGHFYAGSNRIRFFGANLDFGANVPPHTVATGMAAHLAKLGINCVRLQGLDMAAPGGY